MFSFSEEKFYTYQEPAWSSDGRFLAYERTTYTPLADRTDIKESLWIYDDDSGEMRLLLEDMQITGFAWKPQTHVIAYGEMIDPNYFTGRGTVDASLAKGILGLDLDSGETLELVKPQGFSLVNPKWSADGRFLSFDEGLFNGRTAVILPIMILKTERPFAGKGQSAPTAGRRTAA